MIYWASRALMQKKKKKQDSKKKKLSWNTTRAISTHQEDLEPTYVPATTFSAVISQLGVYFVHCLFRSFLPEFQKLGTVSDYQYYNSASLCIKWAFTG